ncbi:MAG: type VI secretion system protein TssA [Chitinispirillaceae bacterium]|nr:type VI secretion system protein TssA [Chitinispirillaceae bacterium]
MLSIITTPLAGKNPFGENINYDPDFDILKNEIGKIGGIDFELLEKTAIRILEKKSKDIRVMSFLSWSYLKSGDWERFSDVYDGLGTLVEQNYDVLFPERDNAKQQAFKWLAESRFSTLLEDKKPTEAQYDHIARLLAGLTKIKPILEKKFPNGSPFPSALFKSVQQWVKSCKPKPKVEPPPPPPAGAGGAAPATAAAAASGQPASAGTAAAAIAEPMETPKQAQGIIRKAALFLVEKEGTKPMGYRLMRSVRWDLLEKAPPAEGGKTQLAGPNAQQRAYFQKLIADREWKTIIEKAEAVFAAGGNHLWLDLQRLITTACKELGADYTPLRNALLIETAMLLRRIPDLPVLSFSDGSPFCDDATKDWIATDVQTALGSGGGTAAGGAASAGDALVEEQRAVNQLVAAGKIEDALAMVQNSLRSSSNERDNFRRTILIGSLLLKAKQPDIAMSVLESLDQKIDRHSLDKWDPDIAVEAWAALSMAYKVGKSQKPQNLQASIQDKQNAVLSKISHIDPGKAFTLNK